MWGTHPRPRPRARASPSSSIARVRRARTRTRLRFCIAPARNADTVATSVVASTRAKPTRAKPHRPPRPSLRRPRRSCPHPRSRPHRPRERPHLRRPRERPHLRRPRPRPTSPDVSSSPRPGDPHPGDPRARSHTRRPCDTSPRPKSDTAAWVRAVPIVHRPDPRLDERVSAPSLGRRRGAQTAKVAWRRWTTTLRTTSSAVLGRHLFRRRLFLGCRVFPLGRFSPWRAFSPFPGFPPASSTSPISSLASKCPSSRCSARISRSRSRRSARWPRRRRRPPPRRRRDARWASSWRARRGIAARPRGGTRRRRVSPRGSRRRSGTTPLSRLEDARGGGAASLVFEGLEGAEGRADAVGREWADEEAGAGAARGAAGGARGRREAPGGGAGAAGAVVARAQPRRRATAGRAGVEARAGEPAAGARRSARPKTPRARGRRRSRASRRARRRRRAPRLPARRLGRVHHHGLPRGLSFATVGHGVHHLVSLRRGRRRAGRPGVYPGRRRRWGASRRAEGDTPPPVRARGTNARPTSHGASRRATGRKETVFAVTESHRSWCGGRGRHAGAEPSRLRRPAPRSQTLRAHARRRRRVGARPPRPGAPPPRRRRLTRRSLAGASRRRRWSPPLGASTCARVSVALACRMPSTPPSSAPRGSPPAPASPRITSTTSATGPTSSSARACARPYAASFASRAPRASVDSAHRARPPHHPRRRRRTAALAGVDVRAPPRACRPSASTCRSRRGVPGSTAVVQTPPAERRRARGRFRPSETFARWSRPWGFRARRAPRLGRLTDFGEGAMVSRPSSKGRRQRRFPQQQLVQPRALGMVLRPRGTQPGDASPARAAQNPLLALVSDPAQTACYVNAGMARPVRRTTLLRLGGDVVDMESSLGRSTTLVGVRRTRARSRLATSRDRHRVRDLRPSGDARTVDTVERFAGGGDPPTATRRAERFAALSVAADVGRGAGAQGVAGAWVRAPMDPLRGRPTPNRSRPPGGGSRRSGGGARGKIGRGIASSSGSTDKISTFRIL